jgi:hypothetical protein
MPARPRALVLLLSFSAAFYPMVLVRTAIMSLLIDSPLRIPTSKRCSISLVIP